MISEVHCRRKDVRGDCRDWRDVGIWYVLSVLVYKESSASRYVWYRADYGAGLVFADVHRGGADTAAAWTAQNAWSEMQTEIEVGKLIGFIIG